MDVLKRRRIREWTCQGVDLIDRSVDEVAHARSFEYEHHFIDRERFIER